MSAVDGIGVLLILALGSLALAPLLLGAVRLCFVPRAQRGSLRPLLAGFVFGTLCLVGIGVGAATAWGGCSGGGSFVPDAVTCDSADAAAAGVRCRIDLRAERCSNIDVPSATVLSDDELPICAANATATLRCVSPYCEPIDVQSAHGLFQPWAVLSDLCFVASGFWLFYWFHMRDSLALAEQRDGELAKTSSSFFWPTAQQSMLANPFSLPSSGLLAYAYALIIVWMGPASMLFHASLRLWAANVDGHSVVIWLGFNGIYVISTMIWIDDTSKRHWPVIVCTAALSVALLFLGIFADFLYSFFVSGTLWAVAEMTFIVRTRTSWCGSPLPNRRASFGFPINLAILAVTMSVWVSFHHGINGVSCVARGSVFPGHAVFHMLASISTFWTALDFASEHRV